MILIMEVMIFVLPHAIPVFGLIVKVWLKTITVSMLEIH